MNCKRVQRRLNVFRAGQLPERLTRRIAAHLEACPVCRAERGQIERLDAVLKSWRVEARPRPGFEQRVWNRIRAAGLPQLAPRWWQRPAWVLGAASATAALMIAITGAFAHQRADVTARQQLYAAIGLDHFDNYPAGSIAADYLSLP